MSTAAVMNMLLRVKATDSGRRGVCEPVVHVYLCKMTQKYTQGKARHEHEGRHADDDALEQQQVHHGELVAQHARALIEQKWSQKAEIFDLQTTRVSAQKSTSAGCGDGCTPHLPI
jgi:hypothetical protein